MTLPPNEDVSREEVAGVFPRVAATVADALACDVSDVALDRRLIEDLGAESIDLLDLVFRLEDDFGIEIPEGAIVEQARGDLPESEFEVDGFLTDAALRRLKAFLSELPGNAFQRRLRSADVPELFTVETFCKIVARELRRKASA